MDLKIAWRNVFANKRRSIMTIILSSFCTIFLIFVLSFLNGTYSKMYQDAIEVYTGYIQITGNGFRDHPDYEHLIFNAEEIEELLSKDDSVESWGVRFETFGLFSTDSDSVGGMLIGIQPEKELEISRLYKSIEEGRFLASDDYGKAIIGNKLATKLNIGIGDKLTYLSSAIDFSVAADIIEVVGIFYTASEFDASGVFVSKKYFDDIFYSYGIATHLIVYPENKGDTNIEKTISELNAGLDDSNVDIVSWRVPLDFLVQTIHFDFVFGMFMYSILVVVIFFVIMIFSILAVLQRTKEIGVLRAVGSSPWQIFRMIVWESLILGVFSIIIGSIFGGALSYYFQLNPMKMDAYSEMMDQYNFPGMIELEFPALLSLEIIIGVCVFMILLNVLAVLYPIWRVNKYKPIEAINYM